jgi:ribosomal-protein-serine acetyltransferase
MNIAPNDRPQRRRIPHRMETERLCLRGYNPDDAEVLRSTVASNAEHLGTFMPWIQYEPQTLEQKIDLILGFRSEYDADRNLVMGIFCRATGQLLGGTGLHPAGNSREADSDGSGPMELGYWIGQAHEGNGYVTESVSALTVVAFRFRPLERMVIRMEPANTSSESIAKMLGFQYEGTTRRSIAYPNDADPSQRRDAKVYSMLRDEFERAPWRAESEAGLSTWDAMGQPVAVIPPAAPLAGF